MRFRGMLVATLMAGVLAGCQHKKAAPVPLAPEAVQEIRQSYMSVDPKARVGVVIAALPEKGLVAVGDVPVADFKEGDVVVFIDNHRQVIAAGKVVAKTADALHVSYDLAGAHGREPGVGDLAVKTSY
jgi:hypothetical protein